MTIKTNEEIKKELQEAGHTVYSISRVNSFNQCKYGYKRTYVDKDRGDNNCYGIAGSAVHDWLEDIQNEELDKEQLPSLLESLLLELEMNGYYFPSKKIGDNWAKDMRDFALNFEPLENRMITEQLMLYEVDKGKHFQGYADVIMKEKNGTLSILDWKTSSEFKGEKLKEAGRQLLIYKDAIEKTTNQTIDKVGWYMIKYVYVTYNGKKRTLSRRDWVSKSSASIKRELKRAGVDDIMLEFELDEAISNNSLESLPQSVQDAFIVESCIQWYDYTQDDVDEAINYVVESINDIEAEFEVEESNRWQPKNNGNVKNDFFCKNLCNHRATCPYLNI